MHARVGIASRTLAAVALAAGAGLLTMPSLDAQIIPVPTTTTAPPNSTTTAPSPSSSVVEVPTAPTTAPPTTAAPGPTTTAKKSGPTTTTTNTAKPVVTQPAFVPPEGQVTTTTVAPFVGRSRAGTGNLPIFVLLSIGGFAVAAVIMIAQFIATGR